MRILIVDDEMVSRTKLKLIMDHFGTCEVVDLGTDAIEVFHEAHQQNDPFGLIMLDINLPDMDGIQVLSAIRNAEKDLNVERYRQAKILMTTSYRDKDLVVASVRSGCNDYIGKPFDFDLIRNKLRKLRIKERTAADAANEITSTTLSTTEQIFDDVVDRINKYEIKLPPLPRIYRRFRDLTAKKSINHKLADLLKKDIAISAELIRLSNSAYYRGFTRNESLEQAISRIGFAATKQIIDELSKHEFYTMQTKKYRSLVENVWKHSIACAYAAEFMSNLLKLEIAAEPFFMGLLHDIGKLALLQIVGDMEREGKFSGGIHTIMLVNILDDYHCQLGARLLEKWKNADIYVHTTLYHNSLDMMTPAGDEADKDSAISRELLLVHLANQVAKLLGHDTLSGEPTDIDLEDVESARLLNLNADQIAKTKAYVNEQMKEALDLF